MSEATPPPPTTPKTVSDKKRFFENVMEDQQKPTPKSGKIFLKIFQVKKVENFCAKKKMDRPRPPTRSPRRFIISRIVRVSWIFWSIFFFTFSCMEEIIL